MILVNNLSRSRINTGKVKLKTSKILKLLGGFFAEGRSLPTTGRRLCGDFEDKQKINPERSPAVDFWYLEINFLTPLKMSELHKKFLKKSGPTTVISVEFDKNFPVGKFSGGGEIYLCPREIKKSGFGLEHFLVHGILHLYGFDHKTRKGEAAMLEKEKLICAKINGVR